MSMNQVDCLVAGGGPAGAVFAYKAARAGLAVRLYEKELFPRDHVGESLLPVGMEIFREMGIELDGQIYKPGAQFFDYEKQNCATYDFADGLDNTPTFAYNVDRPNFDHALLRAARDAGVDVREGCELLDVSLHADFVDVVGSKDATRARYFVDATGSDAFLARRNRSRVPIRKLGCAAVLTHFEELDEPTWTALGVPGYVKIFLVPDGWLWCIPLTQRRLSVGFVKKSPGIETSQLMHWVQKIPELQCLATPDRKRRPERIIANFSYRNVQSSGRRWCCIGDAACFLDPVFSSGILFAIKAAEGLAENLISAMQSGDEARLDLAESIHLRSEHAYKTMGALIYRFYNAGLAENILLAGHTQPDLRAGLISLLAGDLWRDDNPFQKILLSAERLQLELPARK